MDHSEVIEARPLTAWEEASYAFLAEKERRSGSRRTVDAYSRTLQRFLGTLGKTPDQVTAPDVFGSISGLATITGVAFFDFQHGQTLSLWIIGRSATCSGTDGATGWTSCSSGFPHA